MPRDLSYEFHVSFWTGGEGESALERQVQAQGDDDRDKSGREYGNASQ